MAMIKNNDFELGTCRDTFTGQVYSEIEVPESWVAWWTEDQTDSDPTRWLYRPEMKVITKADPKYLDPPRILSGQKAVQWFGFYKRVRAGIYQDIDGLEEGHFYRFTLQVHTWYSQRDDPHKSEWQDSSGNWHQFADGQEGFDFWLGVDALGLGDPFSPEVKWTGPFRWYDQYGLAEMIFQAEQDTATLFIKSEAKYAFKHCDSYIDLAGLEDITPEGGDCPPGPREQYHRTYNVIPGDASEERAVEIFLEGWRRSHETAGGSYDDAGKFGGVEQATARLYDIPEDRQDDFLDFYNGPDGFYPGTEVIFAGNSPEPLNFEYPSTHDPPAITQPFVPGQHLAIDLRSSWALWGDEAVCAFPGTVINDTSVYDSTFGYQVLTRIVSGENTVECRYAHLTSTVYVHKGDTVMKGQPLGRCDNTGASSGDHLHFSIKLNGVYVDPEPLIEWPSSPSGSPRPEGTNLNITLHFTPTGGDYLDVQNFMQTIHPAVAKVCTAGGGGPQIAQLHQWSPNSLQVYRIVDNNLNRFDPSQAAPFLARNLADLQGYGISDFSRAPIYIESINEAYECGATANNAATMAFDLAFIEACENAYSNGANVKAVVFTAPVGNPHVSQEDLGPLLPLAEAAVRGGHLFGPHLYYPSVPDQPLFYQTVSEWYQERFEQFDDYFHGQGYDLFWYGGEGGACQATVGADGYISLNPGCGWKGCGSIDRYATELAWLEQQYAAWNATHENRFLGCSLFTTYGWGWDLFNLIGGDLGVVTAKLATML